jgi:cytochrome c oxidase subunit 3
VPQPSLYPVFLSGGMFLLALGFILLMNKFAPGPWVMGTGAAVIIFVLFRWFGAVIGENQRGAYTDWEDKSFRQGMVWFIGSEVMFFAAFFAALFYCRVISVPALAGMDPTFTLYEGFTGAWPTSGPKGASFTPMGAWGIPAINTALLLTSGVTLTWAHWGLMKGKRSQLNLGLILTGAARRDLPGLPGLRIPPRLHRTGPDHGGRRVRRHLLHAHRLPRISTSPSAPSCWRWWQGRSLSGHFDAKRHFAFEAVAWYWHFVDVVWLLLFVEPEPRQQCSMMTDDGQQQQNHCKLEHGRISRQSFDAAVCAPAGRGSKGYPAPGSDHRRAGTGGCAADFRFARNVAVAKGRNQDHAANGTRRAQP